MTDPGDTIDGAPSKAPRSMSVDVLGALALAAGVFVLLAWVSMIVGAFAGLDQHATRQLSDFVLVVVLLGAVAAAVTRRASGFVALVAALAFAGAWRYAGWGLTYAGDALVFSVAAAFYLTPLVAGIAAIVAGRGRMAAKRAARVA